MFLTREFIDRGLNNKKKCKTRQENLRRRSYLDKIIIINNEQCYKFGIEILLFEINLIY